MKLKNIHILIGIILDGMVLHDAIIANVQTIKILFTFITSNKSYLADSNF